MQPPDLRRLSDGAPRVADRVKLPRCDHSMLSRRQLRQGSMPNLLSFVAHRATKDYGLGGSPLPRWISAVEAGDGGAVLDGGAVEGGRVDGVEQGAAFGAARGRDRWHAVVALRR